MEEKDKKVAGFKVSYKFVLPFVFILCLGCLWLGLSLGQQVTKLSFFNDGSSAKAGGSVVVTTAAQTAFAEINVKELHDMLATGQKINILDARANADYQEKHIKGAVSVPYYNIETIVKDWNKDEIMVTYCTGSSCDTSRAAAGRLVDLGFKKVFRLAAGVGDWAAAGYETATGE